MVKDRQTGRLKDIQTDLGWCKDKDRQADRRADRETGLG